MDIQVDVSEVLGLFDEALTTRQRANAILSAKRAAATILRKAAAKSTRFNDQTGALRASLKNPKTGIKVTRKKNVFVVAGLATFGAPGEGGADEDPYYALWVERGHGGPRAAPPKYFMKGAVEDVGDQAIKAFGERFIKRVKAAAEQGKRKGRQKRGRR